MSTEPRPGDVIRVSYEVDVTADSSGATYWPGKIPLARGDNNARNINVEVLSPRYTTVLIADTVTDGKYYIDEYGMDRKRTLVVTPFSLHRLRGVSLSPKTRVEVRLCNADISTLYDLVTAIAPCTVGQE